MSKKIIDGASAVAVSEQFSIVDPARPATVFMRNDAAPGDLTAGDNANVQISHDNGVTWVNLASDLGGTSLTPTNNHISIYALGTFRLDLTAVTGPLSAYVNT